LYQYSKILDKNPHAFHSLMSCYSIGHTIQACCAVKCFCHTIIKWFYHHLNITA